jgi:dihydroflavonol-4-reductase
MTMAELFALLEKVSGVPGSTRRIPIALLYTLAVFYEAYAHITDRPVLISLASARLITEQAGRSLYNHAKSERELALLSARSRKPSLT